MISNKTGQDNNRFLHQSGILELPEFHDDSTKLERELHFQKS